MSDSEEKRLNFEIQVIEEEDEPTSTGNCAVVLEVPDICLIGTDLRKNAYRKIADLLNTMYMLVYIDRQEKLVSLVLRLGTCLYHI